jgi:L-serine deaminase
VDLAYLDAGSGSLIVQAIVAGAAGVAVAAKLYWRRLTGLFKREKAPAQPADRD